LLAVIIDGAGTIYFAIICGVATLIIATAIWRSNIGAWGIAAIVSMGLLAAVGAVTLRGGVYNVDLTLAFASHASAPLIAVTQRILAETGWAGTGAGTFSAILPIYQDVDELATGRIAPTTAAAIAVEMGRPFFWATLIAAIGFVLALLRGALRRQRDSFYSITGASCVVAITLWSFGNAASLSTPVVLIGAVAIGVAIAQSKRRDI
jgi:hypothetical protein